MEGHPGLSDVVDTSHVQKDAAFGVSEVSIFLEARKVSLAAAEGIRKPRSSVRGRTWTGGPIGEQASIHGISFARSDTRRQRLDACRMRRLERAGSLPCPRYKVEIIRRADLVRQFDDKR
jgi:hypothetical protein